MSFALTQGLMGAAQGLLQGIQTQRQQDQEEIHTKELAAARLQEEQMMMQMKYQYDSAENVQKIEAQKQADLTTGAQKAQSDATMLGQKQTFDATQKAQDRASDIQRAGIMAGATIGAAKIHADAEKQPKPLGTTIWKLPDGTLKTVNPGNPIPAKGDLVLTTGGSVGARVRGGTPGPFSSLGGFGAPAPTAVPQSPSAPAPTAVPQSPSAPSPPPDVAGVPGSGNITQPAAPNVVASPYAEGTKLVGTDGKAYVVHNGKPVPVQ